MDDDDIDNMDFELPSAAAASAGAGADDLRAQILARRAQQQQQPPQQHHHQVDDADEDVRGWLTLYPVYFDATKSLRGGRRVPKALARPRPTCLELAAALAALGERCAVDVNKRHPKDPFLHGRVKVAPAPGARKQVLILRVARRLAQGVAIPPQHAQMQQQLAELARPEQYQFGKVAEQFAALGMGGPGGGMPPGMMPGGAGGGMPDMAQMLAGLGGGGGGGGLADLMSGLGAAPAAAGESSSSAAAAAAAASSSSPAASPGQARKPQNKKKKKGR